MMNATSYKKRLWLLLLIGVLATLFGQTHAGEIFAPSPHESGVFAAQTQASTGENYDGIQYDALDSLLAAKSIPDQRSASGSMLDPSDKSGKLTIAGRALDKHGSSQGKRAESSSFPTSKGNSAAKNQQGQDQLDDILTDPNQGSFHNGKGGADVHAGDGRGARFDSDDKFKGFLEPRR
jgi:hypothetical protein